VVTLASPDDAFGGPLRVALNQAAELSRRGHEVHIAAGWGEDASPGSPRGNARQTLFRHSIDSADGLQRDGESGACVVAAEEHSDLRHCPHSLGTGSDLYDGSGGREGRTTPVRHPNPRDGPARSPPQSAGAGRHRRAALTPGRPSAIRLTQHEHDGLLEVLRASVACEQLPNGVPPARDEQEVDRGRGRQVLCARLHRRKRPVAFVDMAGELVARGVSATFALVGPDDGDLPAVKRQLQLPACKKSFVMRERSVTPRCWLG
jgi:hypothetical protein